MVGSVVEVDLDTHNRITGQRSAGNAFSDTLLHCREEILRHSSAHNAFFKYVGCGVVAGRLQLDFYMAVLTVAAGLLLVFVFHVRRSPDGLPVRNLRLGQGNRHFVSGVQAIRHRL